MLLSLIKYSNILYFRKQGALYYSSIVFVFILALTGSLFFAYYGFLATLPVFSVIILMMYDLVRLQHSNLLDVQYLLTIPISNKRRALLFYLSELVNIKLFTCLVMLAFCLTWKNDANNLNLVLLSAGLITLYSLAGSLLVLLSRRYMSVQRALNITFNLVALLFFFQAFRLFLSLTNEQHDKLAANLISLMSIKFAYYQYEVLISSWALSLIFLLVYPLIMIAIIDAKPFHEHRTLKRFKPLSDD